MTKRVAPLPSSEASWDEIVEYAHQFDGYEAFGFDECARLANENAAETPDEIRAALFFEARRWRHIGDVPPEIDMERIRGLIDRLR